MDSIVTVIVAIIASGGIGTTFLAIKKVWDANGNAGYQRRVKEEQGEESLEAIAELEAEVMGINADLADEEARRLQVETFAQEQQQIIADQAKALANMKFVKEARS